ncbi:DUF4134 domain-containing protein [Sphingobacterium lactis]|uniref:DUF4134 domain-containing protein n=1 Tax=Sphingobacterium TaxID=28453 RepID=UPI0021A3CE2A|nr:DUF4134 domain-containing protein [Sphingobacterium hotanense]MCT1525841.1 DUF4134 domain-containing protein [Sphingobacterium hotanense]
MLRNKIPILVVLVSIGLSLLPHIGVAQPGLNEFREVRNEVNGWYYNMSDFVLALGAIAGIIGGARVYSNWQLGRRNIDQEVAVWFLACLFLSMIGAVLRALYGVN